MKKTKFRYISIIVGLSILLGMSFSFFTQYINAEEVAPDQINTKVVHPADQEALKKTPEEQKVTDAQIENSIAVTSEQLANKPEDYLNKNVKFTAPFFCF